jgi:hypothetical protein
MVRFLSYFFSGFLGLIDFSVFLFGEVYSRIDSLEREVLEFKKVVVTYF